MTVIRMASILTASGLLTTVGFAQTPAGPATTAQASAPVPAARGPSLKAALDAAHAALKTCQALSQKVAVTVVDSSGIVKVVLASDGASSRGVASSTNKAVTALTFNSATSELGAKSATDPELAAKLTANPSFNSHAGGLLVLLDNEVAGAIGVGGAKGSDNDEACAKAGLSKITRKDVFRGAAGG
jgi:uncharacterized protein GlcG (DUF336 family)